MRRVLAVLVLTVFAFLATADAAVCPDGCQSASSPVAAARCDGSGACVFCTGALTAVPPMPALVPVFVVQPIASPLATIPLAVLAPSLDHPPRTI